MKLEIEGGFLLGTGQNILFLGAKIFEHAGCRVIGMESKKFSPGFLVGQVIKATAASTFVPKTQAANPMTSVSGAPGEARLLPFLYGAE